MLRYLRHLRHYAKNRLHHGRENLEASKLQEGRSRPYSRVRILCQNNIGRYCSRPYPQNLSPQGLRNLRTSTLGILLPKRISRK